MGCCCSKQNKNNNETQNTINKTSQNSSGNKNNAATTIKSQCQKYLSENEQQNVEKNNQILSSENISIKPKHLKNQNSIQSFTKVVKKLQYEQNGTQYTHEQEEIYQLPNDIDQFMSDRNIQNASYELKISVIGHNSNSNQTKALQYKNMIVLNNFSKNEIQRFVNENINFSELDFQQLKYSKQFNQFRQYQYFKQKEQKKRLAIKSQEAEESEQIESSMLEKVIESQYDLYECAQEITLLALKNIYNQKGINLLFKKSKESKENQQMNQSVISCNKSYMQIDIQEKKDDYDDIQRHITQTGFDLETYYQIRLENEDEWNYQLAEKNKEVFAKYFKSEIIKKYNKLKDDDIIILNISEGSIIVDFMCPEHIENIKIGSQIFDKIPVKYIVSELQIPEDYFNPDYDMYWEQTDEEFYRGNINGLEQQYHLPVGYYGLGLKVLDNGIYPDDGWLNSDTSDATWIVLFHSTYAECVYKILQEGFKPGNGQAYRESECRFGRGKVGTGVYFSDKIERCEEYGGLIQVGEKYYSLIFQCRVNPKTVKSPQDEQEYYICNNPRDARPYRILIKEQIYNHQNQQE
ncbi:hypothetical protein TTHERM_00400810 (macronuclear) [Tetrahymena thermophila SB210]|uniref:Uncharacterized protein n=1 Tax=Tetrahymena thermophila (strain SB210) TaxID=312017 RepID=I7ME09_TETTS|nr:hypothetical protein TTHERM_00400810 [Tetrahymena thermophila SB210]EAR93809.2 hypothetical protein TTHERM_00400810 [Tetrahymena thermophila SB210]|eukprot:XP_001014054.2 hypothetical protein TTHERM_00400810 [Tetrahymena thermophila SB210]